MNFRDMLGDSFYLLQSSVSFRKGIAVVCRPNPHHASEFLCLM